MAEEITLTINGVDYKDDWSSINIEERLNEIPSCQLKLALDNTNYTNVANGKEVVIGYEGAELMRAIAMEPEYNSDEEVSIKAIRRGAYYLQRKQTGNYQVTTTATNTIVSYLVGLVPEITIGTNTNYGNINYRSQNTSVILSLIRLAKGIAYDWWFDYSGGNERFNIHTRKGSATSVKTFYTYGTNWNCTAASRAKDQSGVWNRIQVRGFGDYNQQIVSTWYEDTPSQTAWGVREKVWTDRTLKTVDECNRLAARILADRKDPVNRFSLEIDDVTEVLPSQVIVGDQITIEDNNIFSIGESKDYKVVTRNITLTSEGDTKVKLECASRTYTFLEELNNLADEQQATDAYQQINQNRQDTIESLSSISALTSVGTTNAYNSAGTTTAYNSYGTTTAYNSYGTGSASLVNFANVGGTIDSGQTTVTQNHSSNNQATTSGGGGAAASYEWQNDSRYSIGAYLSGSYTGMGNQYMGTGDMQYVQFCIGAFLESISSATGWVRFHVTDGSYYYPSYNGFQIPVVRDSSNRAYVSATIIYPQNSSGKYLYVEGATDGFTCSVKWYWQASGAGVHVHTVPATGGGGLVAGSGVSLAK